MSAQQQHPENGVFEFLDRLSVFVHEHSLEFLVGLILLTAFGGFALLLILRSRRKSRALESHGGMTVGYGLLIGNRPHAPPTEPPPLVDPKAPPWDDLRD
jgi:hypothetical protein